MTGTSIGNGFDKVWLPKGGPSEPKPISTPVSAADASPLRVHRGRKTLRAVRPSAAIESLYRRRLEALIDSMARSVQSAIDSTYGRNEARIQSLAQDSLGPVRWLAESLEGTSWPPGLSPIDHSPEASDILHRWQAMDIDMARDAVMAMDASPADELIRQIRLLRRRWLRRFERASLELSRWFASKVRNRNDAELKKILSKAGISVEFKTTEAVRDALKAIVHENVSLIKSIPQRYLTQVEGSVMRSVLAGRDQKTLYDDLVKQHGVTKRRATLIAIDQNNKATAHIQRLRYLEVDISKGIWRHSTIAEQARPTHLANDGNEFDVANGWLDPAVGKRIWPGTEINCRCWFTPVLD